MPVGCAAAGGPPAWSGRDDHGPHDLVGQGLPLGVPEREEVADVADDAVHEVADVPDERVQRADRLAGLLADQLDVQHPLAEGLALAALDPAIPDRVAERTYGQQEVQEDRESG